MLLPSPCPVVVLRRRSFHCFPKMASKLLNRIRTVRKAGLRFVPSRNPPLKTTMLTASQSILHSRSYSDHPNKKSGSPVSSTSSLNEAELNKFSAIAETWWDAEGPFKPLHVMNPTRLAFIWSTLCRHFSKDPNSPRPFEGLKIVDVGCGGGILSEPLACLGATVTGVDALDKNIKIARLHVDLDPMTSSIEYRCTTAEKLVEEQREFDAVIASEVIEHVADPVEFCKSLSALTVSHGATVISTINRSMRSYATAIIMAEYLLHWPLLWRKRNNMVMILLVGYLMRRSYMYLLRFYILKKADYIEFRIVVFLLSHNTQLPKGTHEWSSFLTPEELVLILQRASISIQEMAGIV